MSRARDARRRDAKPRDRSSPRAGGTAVRNAAAGNGSRDSANDLSRLQKMMAHAGVGSRRQCEELIRAGRVTVDGQTAAELGTKVRPDQDVRVDGVALAPARHVYYLVNKPTGVVSTNNDPSGRTRVVDLLPPTNERLFTVGRLDMSSEGLMLVTNDGELANRLAHPRYEVEKTYQVIVAGNPSQEVIDNLRRGVHLAEGVARATSVRVKKALKQSTMLEIVLQEGKNREIRRVLARVGHKVLRLRRVALANLRLGPMAPGDFRRLTADEVKQLRRYRPGRARPPALARGVRGKPRPRTEGNQTPAAAPRIPQGRPATSGRDVQGGREVQGSRDVQGAQSGGNAQGGRNVKSVQGGRNVKSVQGGRDARGERNKRNVQGGRSERDVHGAVGARGGRAGAFRPARGAGTAVRSQRTGKRR